MITKRGIALFGIVLFLYACSAGKKPASSALYEVLTVNNDGGANIKFYEVLTEPKEIMMLLGDETLKKKIKTEDTSNSSFVILNAGPTTESRNQIEIEKVIETDTQIEVYIKDTQQNTPMGLSDENTLFPYTILKINSKKPIVFK